ncbi:MAG TPA: dicarboxylate/amino acid:cation symporter [Vicinamibacterales bacterium]|nr:dicarboxylate/amino acid:cation symporter [Vicinamibacterales bacterium]
MKLHHKIFAGLLIGLAIGAAARLPGADGFRRAVIACEPLGIAFIRLITMVVIPLVVASLFVGVASLGDVRRLGRIGGRTLLYFLVTTVVASSIGLALALAAGLGTGVRAEQAPGPGAVEPTPGFAQMLVNMLPQNPVASAAQGDLMPLIIAVCIFAAAATMARSEGRRIVLAFFEGIYELSMIVIGWMMRLAPAAVLVLIASVVARSGAELLEGLLLFVLTVVAALAIHLVLLLVFLRFAAGVEIATFFTSVSEALLLAFSTASSSVALPVSMAAARTRLHLSNEVVGFVLPSGTTLNKNGAAIYKSVTAVFLAHLYGVPLGPIQLVTIIVTSTTAAFAGAGVPGSSLVTTLVVLNAIGLGPRASAGIALVAGVDRPLDMCRTLVNTIGNLVGAAWIDATEARGRSTGV